MKLLTAEQIRQWDAFTIQNEPISSIDLMERAALQCTEWLVNHQLFEPAVKIFCGKGNNGGDGLAIARQLIARDVNVAVYILEFGARGSADFQTNLQRLHRVTTGISFIQSADHLPAIDKSDIVIDALLGTGLNKPVAGLYGELIHHINSSGATIISIDLPSGMSVDKSTAEQPMIRARHTLTFQCLKTAFLLAENAPSTGQVHVLNIGLHPDFPATVQSDLHVMSQQEVHSLYRPRASFSHKGHHGHVLIIGGESGKTGAAMLAAAACLRAGAGLTSVYLLGNEYLPLLARTPEVMTVPQLELSSLPNRYQALAIGPGMGTGASAAGLLQDVLHAFPGMLVLDADALNLLAARKELLEYITGRAVLTPHPKEFDRLFGSHQNDFDRMYTAIGQAEALNCVIVLKGHHTMIAADGKGYFNTTGNAGLAKGGSGDVLTGIIAALVAQQYSLEDAARLGVFLHGAAADLAVDNEQSVESLVASDVVDHLGEVFRQINS